jgi:hypothetical protein
VLKNIVESSEAGNLEKNNRTVCKYPDFIYISNGVIVDHDGFIKMNEKYFDALESQTYTESAIMFTFIDRNTVILTYGGLALATLKDKQQMIIESFAATLIFRKMDSSWKIIYSHESAVLMLVVIDPTTT